MKAAKEEQPVPGVSVAVLDDEEEILMDECPYVISFFTEFFGMALQMFLGCMGSIYSFRTGPVITSFSFGLGRLACYEIFNHISPVHVNPAKSLGFFVLGRMHLTRFLVYVAAQYSGSLVGIIFLMAVAPTNVENICVTHLHNVDPEQALVMELIQTMILMMAVAGATDPVNEKERDSLSLRIGFIVAGLILTLDPYTSAGKNPARSFAPAFLYGQQQHHWLYEIGPFCGSTLGALLYRFVFDVHERHSLHRILFRRNLHRRRR